eukprot:COSAG04_NODE_20027_length_402_cov_0.983498_1_plen_20_part_10
MRDPYLRHGLYIYKYSLWCM